MTTGATGQLGLALPVQGELSGTWGDTVNNGLTQYINIAIAGTLTLTGDGAVTLSNTTGDASASNITSTLTGAGTVTAQFAIVRVTGTLTVAKVVTAPSYSKTYTVVNAATGGIVTFKASGQTGVSIAVGETAFVYFNGTDYVKVSGTVAVASFQTSLGGLTPSTATTGVVTLAGTLNTTSGGTGLTSFTAGDVPYYASGTLLSKLAIGTAGQFLTSTGTAPQWSTLSGVAVTTFSAGTTGFTPSSATSGAVTLAGTLGTANGGTNLTSFTSGGAVYATSTSALTTGTLPIASGGTGQITANAAFNALVPSQTSNSGKYLTTDGTNTSWATNAGGDVTGPASATNNGIVLFDGTTGKIIKNSAAQDGLIQGMTIGLGAGSVATNTAVGVSALAVNTTGGSNTSLGYQTLLVNADGTQNTAVGRAALTANTSGSLNSAFGRSALLANTTGANNTAVGGSALASNTTASNNTAVGFGAGSLSTGTGNTILGHQAYYQATTGTYNTSIGYQSMNNATTTGSYNVGVGPQSLFNLTTASNNTAVGYQAGYTNSTGTRNVFVGVSSGFATTVANDNTALGAYSLSNTTTGVSNTAIGSSALNANTTASNNTAVGYLTLGANTTASSNVAVGNQALAANTTASYNTAVGYQAGYTNQTGSLNTFIGRNAGYTSNYNGNAANTCVGHSAGYSLTTGYYNTFIGGTDSGYYVTSGTKNTILGNYNGNQGGLDIRTASNYIVLSDGDGNIRAYSNGSLWAINGQAIVSYAGTTGTLALNGTADIVGLSGATGLYQVSVRNSDGGINWRNSSQVFFNGVSSSSIITSDSANVTVTMSGVNIRLTNTNATSIALYWTVLKLM